MSYHGKMVMVGDDDVAALRFLLDGDYDSFGRMIDEWDRPGKDMRLGALMSSTITWAARARFGNGWSYADVARYAEQVRDRAATAIGDVPSRDCEAYLLYVLENQPLPPAGPPGTASTDFALIMALGGDLDAGTRGRVLAEAREQADQRLEYYDRYEPPADGARRAGRQCQDAGGTSGFELPARCRIGRRR